MVLGAGAPQWCAGTFGGGHYARLTQHVASRYVREESGAGGGRFICRFSSIEQRKAVLGARLTDTYGNIFAASAAPHCFSSHWRSRRQNTILQRGDCQWTKNTASADISTWNKR